MRTYRIEVNEHRPEQPAVDQDGGYFVTVREGDDEHGIPDEQGRPWFPTREAARRVIALHLAGDADDDPDGWLVL